MIWSRECVHMASLASLRCKFGNKKKISVMISVLPEYKEIKHSFIMISLCSCSNIAIINKMKLSITENCHFAQKHNYKVPCWKQGVHTFNLFNLLPGLFNYITWSSGRFLFVVMKRLNIYSSMPNLLMKTNVIPLQWLVFFFFKASW